MIDQLASILKRAGLDPTARELADALWLAMNMPAVPVSRESGIDKKAHGTLPQPTPEPLESAASMPPSAAPEYPTPTNSPFEQSAGMFLDGGVVTRTTAGRAIRSPAATALPHALQLGRALRSFNRRILSHDRVVLDDTATAVRIARHLRPTLVMRPAPTRWFELSLVIDDAASMAIWRQTIMALRTLFVRLGAFRDVRVYRLVTDEGSEVELLAGAPGGAGRAISSKELYDPKGQRIVLVVSDCVAQSWTEGRVGALLGEWGRRGPTAILQVLPARLWHRCGLASGEVVRLRAPTPGVRNTELMAERLTWDLSPEEKPTASIAIPVIELNALSLNAWAKMLVCAGAARTGGVMLPTGVVPRKVMKSGGKASNVPTAADRVARFRSMASPMARKLATLFAAAPLSLPVMRLIRQLMVPEATLGHMAEVFLGGLLREVAELETPGREPITAHAKIDPDYVRYDFWEGVRELLLDSASVQEATRVLWHVSEYVTQHLGGSLDFRAWLADPTVILGGTSIAPTDLPFARIGATVLRRLGSEYAMLGEELARRSDIVAKTSTDRMEAEVRDRVLMGVAAPSGDVERAMALAKRVTVGIVTAMPKEHLAVKAMLDGPVDHEDYVLGEIPAKGGGTHAVALIRSGMGTLAATRTARLLDGLPAIDAILMVGIAGGVPSPNNAWAHVRLGDVVVSDHRGVIDYGLVAESREGGEVKTEHRNPPRPPSPRLLDAVEDLLGGEHEGKRPWLAHIRRGAHLKNSARPGSETDVLAGGVPHPEDPDRMPGKPRIFQGAIASSGVLLKDPQKWDRLRAKFPAVRAVEMEGAGLADAAWVGEVGYLVVRGICDYCDETKGNAWQEYAAIVAAAYARAALERMRSTNPGPLTTNESVLPKSTRRAPNNLRLRNEYFRGRRNELASLRETLRHDRAATITHTSIYGLGGVGKSALALEFAHQALERGEYPGGIWWVPAEGKPLDALVNLAPVLRALASAEVREKLSDDTRAEVIADGVRFALQGQQAPSLLVLDDVSERWTSEYLLGGAVRVLVTTRDEGLALGKAQRLDMLPDGQVRELAEALAGRPQKKEERAARDRVVIAELDGLAVAVEMAATAVKRWFHGSWMAYERVLKQEMDRILEDPKLYGDYGRGVFAAIDLSIGRCDEEARALLEGAAVFAPEAIPLEWVLAAAGMEADGLAAARARGGLRELGLVSWDEEKGAVSMHRLVHRRVRARAEKERAEAWSEASKRGVESVATWIEGAVVLSQTRAEMEAVDARRDHVDQALAATERMASALGWIQIADKLATHLHNRALYDDSLKLLQQALAKAEQLVPPDPSRVATSLSNLALVYQDLGQPAVARPLLERALAIDEATYGSDHPNVAHGLSNLATVHRDLGQSAAARPLLEHALAIAEATYGPDHPSVANGLSNLALVHHDLGQPAAARPLLERAIAIAEATYGPDHPTVAVRLSNLALVYQGLGQSAAARSLLERALAIAEATYGPDHPTVALRLSNLATVHKDLGQPAAARPLLERAIAIAEARLPPGHPHLALFRENLAALGPS